MIMDRNNPMPQLSPNDYIIHVDNAMVQEVTANTTNTGYILISYEAVDENNRNYIEQVRLIVSNNTIIIDENGVAFNLFDLNKGMRIDADFSPVMTRSFPPQSNAYLIVVLQEETPTYITTDRVVSVDTVNGFLLTGNPYDINDQMNFNISDKTIFLDQNGEKILFKDIQPGQMVRVEHAIFQTLSIPPQSPAYRVQVV